MGARGPLPNSKPSLRFTAGVPSAPSFLDDDAKKEYRRVVKIMADAPGHLQQVDMSTLCSYAQAFSDFMRLTLLVRDEGFRLEGEKGGAYLNPNANAMSQARNAMREASAKLGFSPADRARASAKTVKSGADNPLEAFG